MTGEEQLKACLRRITYLNKKKDRIYQSIMDELKTHGWGIVKYRDLKNKEDRKYFESYFERENSSINLSPGYFKTSTIPIF